MKINNWDQRYLRLARIVASWSKDPSTKCGAIITRPNNTLASVGYNGFPKGLSDDEDKYNDRNIKYPHTIHSEWNAIRSCQDHSLQGYSVYAWPMPPCDSCTAPLVQKGVKRAVHPIPPVDKLPRWKNQFEHASDMWKQANAQVSLKTIEEEDFDFDLNVPESVDKWDKRFLEVAKELSLWSKDPFHPRGAVITRPDRTIASIGFNGFPQCVDDTPLIMGDKDAIKSRMLAAELNAILFSQDPSMNGCVAYTYPGLPSIRSVVHLIQEGITDIFCTNLENDPNKEDLPAILDALQQVGGNLNIVEVYSHSISNNLNSNSKIKIR